MIANEQDVNLKGGHKMFKSEWRYLFQHKMMLVVLIAIALIPAIYCFIYLSSMWDTYGKMDDLPVAIVNHDQSVTYHGNHITIGKNLTQNLDKSNSLDFHHVSAKTAARRLRQGKYYMVLTIPKDFSKTATTILTATPQKMNLYFKFNSGQNFIASKMTTGAATAIKAKVSAQVTKLDATVVLKALHQATNGMAKAANGGQSLANGAKKLTTGESQMASGTASMSAGVDKLIAGNNSLISGNTTMTNGFNQLKDHSAALTTGLAQIQTGLTQLAQKTPALAQGTLKLNQLAQSMQKQLTSGTFNQKQLAAESAALTTGLQSLTSGSQAIDTGSSKLLAGSSALNSGLTTYTNGVNALATGNQAIGHGLDEVQTNLPALQSGTERLSTGTSALANGSQQILQGSQTLSGSLTAAVKKLSVIHTNEENASALATPVHEVTSDIAKIPNNGTGMAPFAIAIGLYVGGIALGTMYEAFLPYKKPRHALTWWASKASVIGSVGLLQAILLNWSLTSGNHLHVASQGAFFGTILLGSLLFLSLIFCLRLLLGGFGTWLVSIVLVLQLAGSGGLYPTYLVNSFAKAINAWLPMTYLIDALRSLISTHQSIVNNVWIMIALIVGFNLAMILRFRIGLHQSFVEIETNEDDN
ncbi:YhgE/Pip family protein [Lacticaseibacillus chiayiensis]|uniref:YhgE/Pip family protein n=1 Tax=Lacticaseibacillus chiayiensis TaxID=2100821 RepID=UPI001012A112|nr:YhgE/Pip domain-containing protein [Lacticaseibacillus chiayiensis]